MPLLSVWPAADIPTGTITMSNKKREPKRDSILRRHVVRLRPGGFDIQVDGPPAAEQSGERQDSTPKEDQARGRARKNPLDHD